MISWQSSHACWRGTGSVNHPVRIAIRGTLAVSRQSAFSEVVSKKASRPHMQWVPTRGYWSRTRQIALDRT